MSGKVRNLFKEAERLRNAVHFAEGRLVLAIKRAKHRCASYRTMFVNAPEVKRAREQLSEAKGKLAGFEAALAMA